MEISNIFDNRPQIRLLHQVLLTISLLIAFYSYFAFGEFVDPETKSPVSIRVLANTDPPYSIDPILL